MDAFHWTRKKACAINVVLMILLSLPCALGFNVLSGVQPLGEGTGFLDLEDFIVSNLLLPLGSLVYLLFCTTKWGWGFDKYLEETNTGSGLKMPRAFKPYFQFVLPALILVILVQGLI
jgi:NSS family neurotransmitter:Na+ symporter